MCLLFKPPYLALPRLPPRHHATWARLVRTWQRLSCAHRANQLHIAPPAHLRPPPAAASPFRAAWPTLGLSWLAGARPRALRGREWQAGQHVHMVCSACACTGAWVALQANNLHGRWVGLSAALQAPALPHLQPAAQGTFCLRHRDPATSLNLHPLINSLG